MKLLFLGAIAFVLSFAAGFGGVLTGEVGDEDSAAQHPYIASIIEVVGDGSIEQLCGAVVVDKSIVLTSTSCVKAQVDPDTAYVCVGSSFDAADGIAACRKVTEMAVPDEHSTWEEGHEVAVLKVDGSLVEAGATPIRVSFNPVEGNSVAKIAGRGRLGDSYPLEMSIRCTHVGVFDSEICGHDEDFATDFFFCVDRDLSNAEGEFHCISDLGSALTLAVSGNVDVLVGIQTVAFMGDDGMCDAERQPLYARLAKSQHKSFVMDTVSAMGGNLYAYEGSLINIGGDSLESIEDQDSL